MRTKFLHSTLLHFLKIGCLKSGVLHLHLTPHLHLPPLHLTPHLHIFKMGVPKNVEYSTSTLGLLHTSTFSKRECLKKWSTPPPPYSTSILLHFHLTPLHLTPPSPYSTSTFPKFQNGDNVPVRMRTKSLHSTPPLFSKFQNGDNIPVRMRK